MKKIFLGAAALSMILTTGCQNEELVKQTIENEYSLTLDMSAGSRTLHNEAGECVWGDNEALYVVGDGGKVYGKLTMKSKSEGGKKAVFSGKIMGDPGKLQYMVYPVPQADGTIPMGEIDGANHNAPMTGIINRGVVSNVDYAGGLVKIPVKGTNDIAVNAENKDGKVVTGGSYTFDTETGKLTFNANSGSVVTITNIPSNDFVYVPVETDAQEGSTDETERIIVDVTAGEGSNQHTQSFEAEVQKGAVTTNNVPSIEVDEESGALNATVTSKEQLLSAIAAGGNIQLGNDIDLVNVPLIVDKKVTIDLNGKTLTGGLFAESNGKVDEGSSDSYVFWVKYPGNLTITGNGKITSVAAKYSMAVWADGGMVIIENGEFENAGEGSDLIYAKNGGEIIILDGTFKACEKQSGVEGTNEKHSALNLHGGTAKNVINVRGGKFYKFDPSDNQSENPAENFVDDGYKAIQNGDWYYVVGEEVGAIVSNLDELNNVLQTKILVKLVSDITSTSNLTLEGDIQLNLNGNILQAPHIYVKGLTIDNGIIKGHVHSYNNTKFGGITFENESLANTNLGVIELEDGNITLSKCTFDNIGRALNIQRIASHININGCHFLNRNGANYPYINKLQEGGTASITGNIFELPVCFEFEGVTNQYTLSGNTFKSTLEFTSTRDLSNEEITFINNLVKNNTFEGENKVVGWKSNTPNYYGN